LLGRSERNQNLIEDDVVEDVETGGAKGFAEAKGLAAVALDHFGKTAAAERAECGVDGDGAGAAGFFGTNSWGSRSVLVATIYAAARDMALRCAASSAQKMTPQS